MKTPIIGVMLAQAQSSQPGVTHKMQYVNDTYFAAVERAGGQPMGLPLMDSPERADALLALCNGFLLPGGEDVDPCIYGEDPHPMLGTVNRAADVAWSHVVQYALKYKKPLLGICRGLQVANTAMGGTLYQDMCERPVPSLLHMQRQARSYPLHKVTIVPDSRLAEILKTTQVYTNTMHHQCVKDCGSGLKVVAQTGDGVVEALEDSDGIIQLVQWHPEELQDTVPCMRNLFLDLIRRALA